MNLILNEKKAALGLLSGNAFAAQLVHIFVSLQ